MLSKIFVGILLLAVLIMGALTFLCFSSLNSIGFPPQQIVETFYGYTSIFWTALWITTGILLILSNVILWTSRSAWSLWLTFLFFAIFLMVQTMWVGDKFYAFTEANPTLAKGIGFGGIAGAFACVIAAITVFFDQFIVLRLRDKMFKVEKTPVLIDGENEEG